MAIEIETLVTTASRFQHHALLLLCSKFEEGQGLPFAAFAQIAKSFCSINLNRTEDDDANWTQAATHPDVVIIDRERKILRLEEVAEIRKRAQFSPTLATKKLFFIDRCERLGANSANSLLKILEEPLTSCLFLLTARRENDVLSTISSRAQKIAIDLKEIRRVPRSERFETEDLSLLRKFVVKPNSNIVGAALAPSNWDTSAVQVSNAELGNFVESAEVLAKKYSATELQGVLTELLAESASRSHGSRERVLTAELRAWQEAEAFHPTSHLWLLRFFLLAESGVKG